MLSFGKYRLDTLKGVIYHKGEPLDIEPQVYCILELLITRHGELVSRDDIMTEIWGRRVISNNVINNRIRAARAAIGDTGKEQDYIKTYPHRGYKFVGEVRPFVDAAAAPQNDDLDVKPQQDTAAAVPATQKPSFFNMRSLVNLIAIAGFFGLLGLYVSSQFSAVSKMQALDNIESEASGGLYNWTLLDRDNTVKRVAILPFETIGDHELYGFLPDVLETEFNQTLTAVKGLTLVSFAPKPRLESDFKDYKALKDAFDLDYAIVSKLSSYGEIFKLNVSLIGVADSSVLNNETYDLNLSNETEIKDLLADIASKVTLTTANKLNLSVEGLSASWKDYDFYVKIEQADDIGYAADYESLNKAAQLLREAIKEEPNYLPAYSQLIEFLTYQINFAYGDYEPLLKEQTELAMKMQEISARAPETLLINSAFETMTEGGVNKASLGELLDGGHVDVINYVLKKDPDNFLAMTMLAYESEFSGPQSVTVKAYKNVLRVSPTDPWVLPNYSWALFCNEQFSEAREVVTRTSKWHPNHRAALLAELRQSQALGDYESALKTVKRLLGQGIISHEETGPVTSLFFDLGRPDLTLPHVRFPPVKAYVYAVMDNKQAALEAAAVIENFYSSVMARMMVEDDYRPDDYSVDMAYARVGSQGDKTTANICRLEHLIRDTYVLKQIRSDKFELFLSLLTAYFDDRPAENLNTRQEYTALMGLYMLQGDHDKALEVMDIAIKRGFLFISSFREPYIRGLITHPDFAKRMDIMQASADRLLEKYYTQ
jgi:DNA-binding winged helix-turn-helix (wHTH) protein/TolB-like protein